MRPRRCYWRQVGSYKSIPYSTQDEGSHPPLSANSTASGKLGCKGSFALPIQQLSTVRVCAGRWFIHSYLLHWPCLEAEPDLSDPRTFERPIGPLPQVQVSSDYSKIGGALSPRGTQGLHPHTPSFLLGIFHTELLGCSELRLRARSECRLAHRKVPCLKLLPAPLKAWSKSTAPPQGDQPDSLNHPSLLLSSTSWTPWAFCQAWKQLSPGSSTPADSGSTQVRQPKRAAPSFCCSSVSVHLYVGSWDQT